MNTRRSIQTLRPLSPTRDEGSLHLGMHACESDSSFILHSCCKTARAVPCKHNSVVSRYRLPSRRVPTRQHNFLKAALGMQYSHFSLESYLEQSVVSHERCESVTGMRSTEMRRPREHANADTALYGLIVIPRHVTSCCGQSPSSLSQQFGR